MRNLPPSTSVNIPLKNVNSPFICYYFFFIALERELHLWEGSLRSQKSINLPLAEELDGWRQLQEPC